MGRLLSQHSMVRRVARHRSRRGILVGGIVAAWGLAAGAPVAAAVPAPGLVSPPDLPPQPGVSAAPCRNAVPQPGAWTLIATQRNGTPSGHSSGSANFASFPAPGYQITVDPQLPCRMYRATDAQTLDRSLDSGRTWTQVFHDDRVSADAGIDPTCSGSGSACAGTTQPFTASGIGVLHAGVPGLVTLSERGNGDAAVRSADAGTTWQTVHGGVAGIANRQVDRIVTVSDGDPHHPVHALAVTEAPAAAGAAIGPQRGQPQVLYATTDGGATWTPSLLPAGAGSASTSPDTSLGIPAVVAEPQASGLAWAVAQGNLQITTNSGLSWTAVGLVPAGTVRQLVVLHPAARNQQLLLIVNQDGGTFDPVNSLFISGDGDGNGVANGVSWRAVKLPPLVSPEAVATTEYNGTILVAATETTSAGVHRRARLYLSRDGLRSMTEVASPQSGYTEASITTPLTPVDGSTPPEAILQSDTRGSFYVGITACSDERFVEEGGVDATCNLRVQSFWRYTPPAQPVRGTGVTTGVPGGIGTPLEATTELFDCQLSSAGVSSPLAFDGRDLIYPDPSPATRPPLTDRLEIVDPQSCLTTPPRAITVHFDARDTVSVCSCTQIAIEQITYDPLRRQVLFGINGGYPLFTAPWPAPTAAITDIQAHLAFAGHRPEGCANSGDVNGVAYDYSNDTLWTCAYDAAGQRIGDHIRASDGGTVPDPCYGNSVAWLPGEWTAGAPGRLFQWSEDDTRVFELDTATCIVVRQYVHRPVVEPAREDESLACDPLTFTHMMGWVGPEATVFWLRESGLNQLIAFAAPSALCPVPTATLLLAPASIACGQGVALSATLQLLGPQTPLPGLTVEFRVDGVRIGTAVTDARGVALLTAPALSIAGVHQVEAHFAGSSRLLASQGVAPLTTTARDCPQPARPSAAPAIAVRGGLLPPPTVPGGPPPVMQPQPGAQAANAQSEAQAQVQAQAQTQSQVQSQTTAQLQPGVMPQRQRQAQVATQGARNGQVSPVLSATALRQPAAALLLCAVALLGGARVGVATAEGMGERRRRGQQRDRHGRERRFTR